MAWQNWQKEGFIGGNVDTCLYMKKSEKGVVYIALYMDDHLLIGNPEAILERK